MVSVRFSGLFDAAKGDQRAPSRFLMREPGPHTVVHVVLEMTLKFPTEVFIATARPDKSDRPQSASPDLSQQSLKQREHRSFSSPLLDAQGDHRIHAGGSERGQHAGQQGDAEQNRRDGREGHGIVRGDTKQLALQRAGESE